MNTLAVQAYNTLCICMLLDCKITVFFLFWQIFLMFFIGNERFVKHERTFRDVCEGLERFRGDGNILEEMGTFEKGWERLRRDEKGIRTFESENQNKKADKRGKRKTIKNRFVKRHCSCI